MRASHGWAPTEDLRMSVTNSPARRRRREPDVSHRVYDLAGVTMVALAILTVISLLLSDTGLLGQAISTVFRLLFGWAAWVVPFVFLGLGITFITGRRRIEVSHLTIGVLMLFLAFVGVLAKSTAGDYFDSTMASESGGFLGAFVAWAFQSLLGSAKLIGLGAMMMMGMILIVPAPIRSLYEVCKEKLQQRRGRVAPVIARRERTPKALAVVEASNPDVRTDAADDPSPKVTRRAPLVRGNTQSSGG